MMNGLLDAALRYANAGIPVFPCQPQTKAPLVPRDLDQRGRPIPGTGGHKKATTDAATIRRWWTRWPDAWIGVPTGRPDTFDVMDLDCHEGKPNGFVAIPEWRSLSPVMQITPSGGAHPLFKYDPLIKSTTSQIAPGVDTRGRDGYIIVAPSPGYKWVNGGLLDGLALGLPDWPSKYRPDSILVSAKQKTSSAPEQSIEMIRAAVNTMPNPDLDWEEWSARGMAIFRASGGSDEGLELFDEFSRKSEKYEPFAVNERWDHWGSSSPPTRIGFGSLAHWADEAHGSPHWRDDARPAAEDEFDAIEIDESEEPRKRQTIKVLFLSKAAFLKGFVPPDWLIDGMLQRRFIYSLTGQTGHFKTAIALLIAELVASYAPGAMLGKHAIEHGRVAYFVGENPDDVRIRVIGADSRRGDDPMKDRIIFIPGVFDINGILTALSERGPFDLVIVDTSAAYFLGDEELSNSQMGAHARMLRRLSTVQGGPCVLVLCHPIKHVSEPSQLLPRGGGAFLAEIDGNLTAWRRDDLVDLHHTTKFRGPGFEPITFKLQKITTPHLVDSKGRQIPTVRVVPVTEGEEKAHVEQVRRDEDQVLVALLEDPTRSWADVARALKWVLANGEPHKSRVSRALDRLKDSKPALAKNDRGKWMLTKEGVEAAKNVIPVSDFE